MLISRLIFAFVFLLDFSLISCQAQRPIIPDQSFNEAWLFAKGEQPGAEQTNFEDANWRQLDLPHDWAIEGPFDSKYNARTGGLPVHGIGWYRKHFEAPTSWNARVVSLEFDGAMNNAEVWLNGKFVGKRPFGYIGFEVDLTPHLQYGQENVVAVKLSPEDLAARWYTGAGIYRNVRLKCKAPVHIPQYGTYITTPKISNQLAEVVVQTTVRNQSLQTAEAILLTQILNPKGEIIAEQTNRISVPRSGETTEETQLKVPKPQRWDINQPNLYRVLSTLRQDGHAIDIYESEFGIRTITFTPDDGFLLNGRRVQLNGVCMHHDLGGLGAAVNYRATERQMQIMQSMGVNALRTSHNPPSPEMLKVCDRLGIVVQVEAFDEWQIGKVPNGYHKYFDEWHERDLRDMIKRDRNHPSVIMWSIGNEILEQGRPDGWKVAKMLSDICHDEDPTRPTTAGFNYYPAPFKNKLAYQIDVVGMNYWPSQYAAIKAANPEMIIYGSETSSQTSSRGVYHLPLSEQPQKESGHVSSYDVILGPPWAYPPDAEFQFQEKNPFSLGEFIWTGFDYLGEPTPYGGRDNSTNGYWNDDWPSRSSYFAPVDLCGFPKDRYYLYQSQWTTEPMVHVLPHWNWAGKEGQMIPVYAYTNAEEVELFVNGVSQGKKVKGKDLTPIPAEFHDFEKGTFMSPYRLSWEVPYQAGSIKVVAYTDDQIVAQKLIKTAGEAAKITLTADRTELDADGQDLSFITVKVVDAADNLCPLADDMIHFEIEGAATLAAVANGNQRSLESFQLPQRKVFNGMCQLIVRTTKEAGEITIKAKGEGLTGTQIELRSE